MIGNPTPQRLLVSGLVTLAVAAAMWAFVSWRSAPPPPPKVTLPGETSR